jgi:hypothetical protein
MVEAIWCRKTRGGMDPPLRIGFGLNYGAAWAYPFRRRSFLLRRDANLKINLCCSHGKGKGKYPLFDG